jgi:hypothetical protein
MKKLTRADIRGPRLYGAVRDDLRKRAIEVKRVRRVALGPTVSVVFENRITMIFQVEEMCRAEGLEDPQKIQEEVDTYNHILPDPGQLGATLLVEITEQEKISSTLNELVGLQDHLWLELDGHRIPAHFDAEQFASDRFAAVQYLRFSLDERAQKALRTPSTPLKLIADHPRYRHETLLQEETRASLATDLD